MKLTIIGSATPFPTRENPCSAYLITTDRSRILVDCGAGALMELTKHMDPSQIDAVVLSHLHGDHMSDMLVLKYAVDIALALGTRATPLPVYCPPGSDIIAYKDAVIVHPIAPSQTFAVAGITCSTFPANHPGDALCLKFSDQKKTLCYTGDTGPHSELSVFFRAADLLLCEATFAACAYPEPIPGHLSGRDAGALAVAADCGHLILTHISCFSDPDDVIAEARAQFSGQISLAQPGLQFDL